MCINKITEITDSEKISNPTCPVCLEDLLDIEKQNFNSIRKFYCGHLICFQCFSQIKIVNKFYNKKCPLCRHASTATLANYNNGKCAGCGKEYINFSRNEKFTYTNSCLHIFCFGCTKNVGFFYKKRICPLSKVEHGGLEPIFFY